MGRAGNDADAISASPRQIAPLTPEERQQLATRIAEAGEALANGTTLSYEQAFNWIKWYESEIGKLVGDVDLADIAEVIGLMREESCDECGNPLWDNEGWDGYCGSCADRRFGED
jgi:hypothetical protein